jgi:phosphoribosylformimino-5-aminoimidazole carboxamide ribonucleotide (ProFAR) isomerase
MTNDEELRKLREVMDRYIHLVYEAIKAGKVHELSREGQVQARAIQDHLHLRHVRMALEHAVEFAGGERYEIEFRGEQVSPLAHVAIHAAVEGQIESNENVRAAFEQLLAVGVDAHQAKHILGMIFTQHYWEASRGSEPAEITKRYEKALRKIRTDPDFRRKWIRRTSSDHPWSD